MKRSSKNWFGRGFLIGSAAGLAYLLFGDWQLFYVPEPKWAQIVFAPGVYAGHYAHGTISDSWDVCKAIGVTAMGVTVGLLAMLVRFLFCKKR